MVLVVLLFWYASTHGDSIDVDTLKGLFIEVVVLFSFSYLYTKHPLGILQQ